MSRPVAFPVAKGAEVWDALVAGFGARVAPRDGRRILAGDGPAILGGLQFDMPALLREARERRHPYYFCDNGYFRTHEAGARVRYRVAPSCYCQAWINWQRAGAGERFDALRLELKPWRRSGRHILVTLSSPAHTEFFGLAAWHTSAIAELRRHTDRPVVLRRKAEVRADDLAECWAVVTWSSKLACKAVLAGIPVFTGPESGAAPMATADLAAIERPYLAENRREWANSLAWAQYTVAEIRAGLAAAVGEEALAERARQSGVGEALGRA